MKLTSTQSTKLFSAPHTLPPLLCPFAAPDHHHKPRRSVTAKTAFPVGNFLPHEHLRWPCPFYLPLPCHHGCRTRTL
jgi:hypothetical protein